MKRDDLEKYIGLKVCITLFDKDVIEGELHKTGEERFKNDINLYLPKNLYFCIPSRSCLFRCSHVIKLKRI